MKQQGESLSQILWYWLPELISIFIIIALPPLFDAYLIAGLRSTVAYGALGMATNLLHLLTKLSEAVPVAAIAIIGRHNGAREYEKCGDELVTTFWTTVILGITQLIILTTFATQIYCWLGVPASMAVVGAPFLRLRSLGIFLAFVLWAFMGFLRAVKNTRIPMLITLIGTLTQLTMSYLFIPGNLGMPQLGIYGAALATIVQYSVMLICAGWYVLRIPAYQKYLKKAYFYVIQPGRITHLILLSIPILIDKSSLAFAYVWLSKMIAPMGANAIAAFDIIKNLERSAIMPAGAFAQVVMFLVSNRLGANDPEGAKANIRKIMWLTASMVSVALLFLWFGAHWLVGSISPSAEIVTFAVPLLRLMSLLVIFDFIQIILAAALRGAGQVRTVMWARAATCFLFFVPVSYLLSLHDFSSTSIKFSVIYGTFYLNTALMGLIFLVCIKRTQWYIKKL
jgi:putative MATE family efflux protein